MPIGNFGSRRSDDAPRKLITRWIRRRGVGRPAQVAEAYALVGDEEVKYMAKYIHRSKMLQVVGGKF